MSVRKRIEKAKFAVRFLYSCRMREAKKVCDRQLLCSKLIETIPLTPFPAFDPES